MQKVINLLLYWRNKKLTTVTMQNNDLSLLIKTGNTVEESLQYLKILKHAMCCAMMAQVETDTVNKNFEHYQIIYLEAHHLETIIT